MSYSTKFIWKLIISFLLMTECTLFLLSSDFSAIQSNNEGNEYKFLQEEINKFLFEQLKSDKSFHAQYGEYIKIIEIRKIAINHYGDQLFNVRVAFEKGMIRLAVLYKKNEKSHLILTIPDTDFPELDKSKMLKDFDWMVDQLEKTFPAAHINNVIFNLDIWKKLASYRKQITGRESFLEYAALLSNAVKACKGNHLWLSGIPYRYKNHPIMKLYHCSDHDIDVTWSALVQLYMLNESHIPVKLKYYDGNFYAAAEHLQVGNKLPCGAVLLTIDNQTPTQLLSQIQDKLNKYDFKRRIFYGSAFDAVGDNFYVFLNRKSEKFKFQTPEGKSIVLDSVSRNPIHVKYPDFPLETMPKRVQYFKKEKILYFRIPAMDLNDFAFYESKIAELKNEKEIRAVILDVRFNLGGNDYLWKKILALLIADPLTYGTALATLNTPIIHNYRRQHANLVNEIYPQAPHGIRPYTTKTENKKIGFLGNLVFSVTETTEKILPAKNSLKLSCPFFLFVEDIYSSAGGLLALCNRSKSMFSVGFPSSLVLGQGITPLQLALPGSGLIFSVATDVDIFDCKNAFDTVNGKIKIPLKMRACDYFKYRNSNIGKDYSAWLLNDDPFMQTVFEHLNNSPK